MQEHEDKHIESLVTPESLTPLTYFQKLTLSDLYGGAPVIPGTQIVTDISMKGRERLTNEELEAVSQHYGVRIGSSSYGGGREFYEFSVADEPAMVAWAPHLSERKLLLDLSRGVSDREKPFIVDAGCGKGFLSKLLASDGHARVLGIDRYLGEYEALPETEGEVELVNGNLRDNIGELGPERLPYTQTRILDIIDMLASKFDEEGAAAFYEAAQYGMQGGYSDNYDEWMAELQALAAEYEKDSSVDMVVCSFMSTGQDLTPVIRDGVHPKAIVYIKPNLSGVGNYYTTYEEGEGLDKAISFNPGRNYRTAARWQTPWADDKGRYNYRQQMMHFEPAEVIVQVRNDVSIAPVSPVDAKVCIFDGELEKMLRFNEWKMFSSGVEDARQDLGLDRNKV